MHRNLIGAVRLYFDVDALPNQMGKEPTLRLAGNARSGKGDGSGRWRLVQVQAAQERRLSGSGWADNDHILTGADMLGNIIEHEVVAERFGQMFNVDHFDAASFQAHRAAWKTA